MVFEKFITTDIIKSFGKSLFHSYLSTPKIVANAMAMNINKNAMFETSRTKIHPFCTAGAFIKSLYFTITSNISIKTKRSFPTSFIIKSAKLAKRSATTLVTVPARAGTAKNANMKKEKTEIKKNLLFAPILRIDFIKNMYLLYHKTTKSKKCQLFYI